MFRSRVRPHEDNPVARSPLAFEAAHKLLRRDRRRPHFAHDDARGVIGKNGGLNGRSPGGDGHGKGGDHRVAGAGDIKYFLRDRGDVKRFVAPLAEQHPLISEGDEQERRLQFVEEFLRGFQEVDVLQRFRVARGVGQASEFEGFFAIRGDERQARQAELVDRFGIEAQPDPAGAAELLQPFQKKLA